MTQLGVPVPAGFTITTEACRAYMRAGGQIPDGLDDEIDAHVAALEEKVGEALRRPRTTRCSSPFGPARRSRCRG